MISLRLQHPDLLADPGALARIWEVFACPFPAHAAADDEVGLLMDDLTAYLPPDVRAPLDERSDDAVLDGLVRLQARFWNATALENARLAAAPRVLGMLGPRLAQEVRERSSPEPVLDRAMQGWGAAAKQDGVRLHRPTVAPAR